MSEVASLDVNRPRKAGRGPRDRSRRVPGRPDPLAGSATAMTAARPAATRERTLVAARPGAAIGAAERKAGSAGVSEEARKPRRASRGGAWGSLVPAAVLGVAILSVLALGLPRPGAIGEPRFDIGLVPPASPPGRAIDASVGAVGPIPQEAGVAEPAPLEAVAGDSLAPSVLERYAPAPAGLQRFTESVASLPIAVDVEPSAIGGAAGPRAEGLPDDRMIGLGAATAGERTVGDLLPAGARTTGELAPASADASTPQLVSPVVPVSRGQSAAAATALPAGTAGTALEGETSAGEGPAPKPVRVQPKAKAKAKAASAVAPEPPKAKPAKTPRKQARKPVASAGGKSAREVAKEGRR